MLSAENDDNFLINIDGIFKSAFETERLFVQTLEEKDKFVM